jgi:hypothetical protein
LLTNTHPGTATNNSEPNPESPDARIRQQVRI